MVYIDFKNSSSGWSHMISESIDELHIFAKKVGLKFEWFQDKPGKPHYDIRGSVRKKALVYGAVEVSPKEIVKILKVHYN